MKTTSFTKAIVPVCLLTFMLLLTACPYSSTVPVDNGSAAVSAAIAGEWVSASDKDAENPKYYKITVTDKSHATVAEYEYSSDEGEYSKTSYEMIFSDVKGDTFLNIKKDGDSSFSIYRFTFNEKSNELNLSEVTPYIREKFSTSAELKKFIARNKTNSYFFTDEEQRYVRK